MGGFQNCSNKRSKVVSNLQTKKQFKTLIKLTCFEKANKYFHVVFCVDIKTIIIK
jgi:hypothetical protein